MSDLGITLPGDSRLNTALVAFTGCVGESLDDLCSYGLTIGETYVPFDQDEDEEDCSDDDGYICSQAWVRVESATAPGNPSWDGQCATGLQLVLEVGVKRCFQIEAEAPTASDVMGAALQSMDDMNRILCAALSCEDADGQPVFDSIQSNEWVPMGPLGGEYGGIWIFTVTLD